VAVLALTALCAVGWAARPWTAPVAAPLAAATVAASVTAPVALPTVTAPAASQTVPVIKSAVARRVVRPADTPPAAVAAPSISEAGSPLDACAGRNFFSRAACVDRQCTLPRWQTHPQCVEARRFAEQRRQSAEH
jgi:hypothetical protein